MQFIKNISLLSAVLATFAAAAPIPEAQGNIVMMGDDGKPFIPKNGPTATSTATASTITITKGAAPATSTAAQQTVHTTQQAAAPTTTQQAQTQQAQTQTQKSTQAEAQKPSAATQSAAKPSSSSSSPSSGGSSAGLTPGQLTIVNKCSKPISISRHQGEADTTTNSATVQPGSSGHIPMDGDSQAAWITWEGITGYTAGGPGIAIVEWNKSNPFLDLSLIKGNPFVITPSGGQSMTAACGNPHINNAKTTTCDANTQDQCKGAYFSNSPAQDKGFSCPELSQGVVYTACSS